VHAAPTYQKTLSIRNIMLLIFINSEDENALKGCG